MTRDDIIQWAKEAGFSLYDLHDVDGQDLGESVEADDFDALVRLAEAVAAAGREAIANMIEHGDCPKCVDPGCGHGIQIGGPARRAYAATIRAREDGV